MYAFLTRYFPPRAADWLMAFWYFALIVLVLYFAFEPQGEFRYLNY